MKPNQVAERYFACVRARDIDGLMSLYAEDATFVAPNGKEISGVAAIRAMQLSVFSAAAPFPTPLSMVVGENAIAVEIEARLPDGTVRNTVNLYYLNDAGRIMRLSVYMRSI